MLWKWWKSRNGTKVETRKGIERVTAASRPQNHCEKGVLATSAAYPLVNCRQQTYENKNNSEKKKTRKIKCSWQRERFLMLTMCPSRCIIDVSRTLQINVRQSFPFCHLHYVFSLPILSVCNSTLARLAIPEYSFREIKFKSSSSSSSRVGIFAFHAFFSLAITLPNAHKN